MIDTFTPAQEKRQHRLWNEVTDHLESAKAISWDGCHKIYLLMDDEQLALQRQYGYDPIITHDLASPSEMLTYLKNWFHNSCGLKFIQAVETNEVDPNDGFTSLIDQGEDAFMSDYVYDYEEEEDELL